MVITLAGDLCVGECITRLNVSWSAFPLDEEEEEEERCRVQATSQTMQVHSRANSKHEVEQG